ncbi:MAG: 2-oxoacid:ferredoxin oxidoreductase subunit beta [Myxococcales bacterium]|jgi:2-oxoglutarate ferredoxin oxidoreductase subunit beta
MSDTNPTPDLPALTRKDFESGQAVRWCPGCGSFSVLAQVQKTLPTLGVPREKLVFVSGIGCSSRFPYYMNTYGLHGIHGRAPAVATGLKLTRPDLEVWVATGDGDALSIGGNHLIHALRRNVGLKIILFNNRIYGMTKGQSSPTSVLGQRTKSAPFGNIDLPFSPLSVALGAEATFVARSIDAEPKHLGEMIERVARHHRGTALLEVFQNCVVFNDKAFRGLLDKETKADHQLVLEHGKPMLFGKERSKGLRFNPQRFGLEVVELGKDGVTEADILVHDEKATSPGLALMLAGLTPPDFPTPLGVLRALERPVYEQVAHGNERAAIESQGPGSLESLLESGESWEIR